MSISSNWLGFRSEVPAEDNQNPLYQYMADGDFSIPDIAKITGLPNNTIRKSMNLDDTGILNMRLRTVLIIKKRLRVTMSRNINYQVVKNLKLTHKDVLDKAI